MKLPVKTIETIYLPEPVLGFGRQQTCDHPKDGLFLYGPHSAPEKTKEISVGVIGTEQGIAFFQQWAKKLCGFIDIPARKKTDKEHRLHLSNFPGLEETFGIKINPDSLTAKKISSNDIDEATRTLNHHEAVKKSVDLYIEEIERHDRNEERKIDVWILVLPELIFDRCKPLARRSGLPLIKGQFVKKQKAPADLPLLSVLPDQADEEIFNDIPDFHRQIKARLLKLGHASEPR